MKRLQSLFMVLVALLVLCLAGSAQAVTCTLNGSVRIEPMDNYYCKTGTIGCTGWKEVNLHQKKGTNAAPMRYMFLRVREGGTNVGFAVTNGNGDFTATLNFASGACSDHTVSVRYFFNRMHEADVFSASPRERFAITDVDEGVPPAKPQPGTSVRTYLWPETIELTGPITAFPDPHVFLNEGLSNPRTR